MKPCGLPSLVTGLTLVLTSSARLKTHESVLDSLDGSIKRQTQSESERPSVISSFVSNETGLSNGTWPWQIYKTEPYNPPVLEINATGEALSPGYIFISPSNFEPTETPSGVKQSGPLIFTDKGMSYSVKKIRGRPSLPSILAFVSHTAYSYPCTLTHCRQIILTLLFRSTCMERSCFRPNSRL